MGGGGGGGGWGGGGCATQFFPISTEKQPTRELINAQQMSHKHNNKDLSDLR